MEHSPHHLGPTRNRVNLERRHIVLGVAPAANTPLKVARHAGSFVEDRPQTIAAGQRIAGLPIMLEQGQASLLDHRAGPRARKTGMPGVRAQTTHKPKNTESPRPTRRRIRANELPNMVKPPRRNGAAAAVMETTPRRGRTSTDSTSDNYPTSDNCRNSLEFLQGGRGFFWAAWRGLSCSTSRSSHSPEPKARSVLASEGD